MVLKSEIHIHVLCSDETTIQYLLYNLPTNKKFHK